MREGTLSLISDENLRIDFAVQKLGIVAHWDGFVPGSKGFNSDPLSAASWIEAITDHLLSTGELSISLGRKHLLSAASVHELCDWLTGGSDGALITVGPRSRLSALALRTV